MSDSRGLHTPGILTQRSMITQGDWLVRVCNPGEIDLPGYATPGRFYEKLFSMAPRGIILQWDWLPRVLNPGESCLCGFLLTRRGMIPWQVKLLYSIIRKYLIVLFTLSVESDEIETSSFFKCKTALNKHFIPKFFYFFFYNFWVLKGLKVSKNAGENLWLNHM